MKKQVARIVALCCAAGLLIIGCSLDPDRKLNKAIDSYVEKQPDSLRDLQSEFIKNIAIDSVDSADIHSTGTLLYRVQENTAEVVYPLKQSFTLTDGEGIIGIDRTVDYAVITDGLQFSIFDGDGGHLHDETISDKKTRVKAVLVDGDGILYFKNSKLFRYSIIHHSSEQLTKESFPPPYANYYQVYLSKRDDLLAVVAGIAGSHSFNLVNLSNGSIMIRNLGMSSSKHHLGINTLLYITGNSGSWELTQYSIAGKEKKSLAKLADIIDIELAAQGYVVESTTGLWASEYGKERKRIPFPYKLVGKYRGRVLLQNGETCYIIEMKKLLAGLAKLMEKTPDLFAPVKQ